MSHNNNVFTGAIVLVRIVEDCIRATQKYTEGIGTMRKQHPIQGEDFPSKAFSKYYEVYPEIELSWEMPASKAWEWVWGDTPHYDVIFRYDYRSNIGAIRIKDGYKALSALKRTIPGFRQALASLTNGNGKE